MTASDETMVIYDLGANVGDNIEYYLMKADRVVAVEAVPQLADHIRKRYAEAVAQDRLRVENCVLVAGKGGEPVDFYLNRENHRMNRFLPPENNPHEIGSSPDLYEKTQLPSVGICELIERHGAPYFMKTDLEYYDETVLRTLFANQIFPPRIQVESHSIEIFSLLLSVGGYRSFKLIDGRRVADQFANYPIQTRDGPGVYSFADHAAGPCGDDLPGVWRDPYSFFRHLAISTMFWKDIHASRIDPPVPRESLVDYLVRERTPKALQGVVRSALTLANRLVMRTRKWPKYEAQLTDLD